MAKYSMPYNQYKACMKMTKNQFSRWVDSFASAMWEQGYTKAMEATADDNSVLIDTSETMLIGGTSKRMKS